MDKIIKTTTDRIVSPIDTNEFVKITGISKDETMQYHYYATIVENRFSQKIIKLYDAFDESTDTYNKFEIEEEINKYQLKLRENDIKIFRLEWKDNRVSFYTKYPTLHGFMKDYKIFYHFLQCCSRCEFSRKIRKSEIYGNKNNEY